MKLFRREFNATVYTLTKNYRSREGIIHFNNAVLKKLQNRMKVQQLIAAKATKNATIELVKYNGSFLAKPLVKYLDDKKLTGNQAVLTRTNYEALLVNSMLIELGYKTRLIAGFEGFSLSQLDEIRSFGSILKSTTGEAGVIFENDWLNAVETFKKEHIKNKHSQTCLDVLYKFQESYPDKKMLIDWWDYCREIKMEDAIHADSNSIIVSTMHKAKGKEFDHVYMLVENYDFQSDEAKRLLYVASTRAKESLYIHTNSSFYDDINLAEIKHLKYEGELHEPHYYDLILNHKEVNLNSQKYLRAKNIINKLKTGETLLKDIMKFGESEAPGLSKLGEGNMLLFSREFIKEKLVPFKERGYDIASANVEYLVYWYDREEDKEYKIVLPKLRFEKK